MNNAQENSVMEQELEQDLLPGKILKSYRLNLGLSLDEVSAETRIPLNSLTQIESDNYAAFTTPVFVLGYIRRYARVVGADADQLIRYYHEQNSSPEAELMVVETPSIRAPAPKAFPLTQIKMGLSIAALVLVAIVLVMLAPTWSGSGSRPTDSESAPVGAAIVAKEPGAQRDRQTVSEQSTESEVLESPVPADSDSALAQTVSSVAGADEDVVVSVLPVPEPPASDESPVDVSAELASAPLSEPLDEALPGESLLEISFREDCWVEVKDASEKTVFAELKNKGDNLRLFGLAPFNVMLGNARAADIRINGRQFGFEPLAGRTTLRLSVFATDQ